MGIILLMGMTSLQAKQYTCFVSFVNHKISTVKVMTTASGAISIVGKKRKMKNYYEKKVGKVKKVDCVTY